MKMLNYMTLCLALSAIVFVAVHFIPGLGDFLESELLRFLTNNA